MIHLVVTPRARRDHDEILRHLVKEAGVAVTRKFAGRFRDGISRLIEMPAYGAPRPELGPECRIVVITPYVLLYEYDVGRDQVTVLRILMAAAASPKSSCGVDGCMGEPFPFPRPLFSTI